ncbi:hypothetical protein ACYE2N_03470 [Flavobacterium sp. MAHUQ-51]|uniref:hypothetical protein n=1 Tax=Flavobacterium sp. GCM10022190 TaxID=3252639 RepID=UPI0036063F1A
MRFIVALAFSLILLSCNESFEVLDTEKFNIEIASRSDIKTPEELITIFYNFPENESKPKLEISKTEISENVFEITLIHDNQQDDSQKAEKIIMTAEKVGTKWFAKKIIRNWKCYSGRWTQIGEPKNCN